MISWQVAVERKFLFSNDRAVARSGRVSTGAMLVNVCWISFGLFWEPQIRRNTTIQFRLFRSSGAEPAALMDWSFVPQEASSDFQKFGIHATSVTVDIPTMQSYKDSIVTGLTRGIEGLFKKNKVDYVKVRPHELFRHGSIPGSSALLAKQQFAAVTLWTLLGCGQAGRSAYGSGRAH